MSNKIKIGGQRQEGHGEVHHFIDFMQKMRKLHRLSFKSVAEKYNLMDKTLLVKKGLEEVRHYQGYQLQSHCIPSPYRALAERGIREMGWEVESVAEQMVLLFRPIPCQGVHMYGVH